MSETVVLDELFADIGEVAEDIRAVDLARGQTIHLHVKVESGGPFELLIQDPTGDVIKTIGGISREHEFEQKISQDGGYGFAFQSTGKPGAVRLIVSLKPS